MPKPAPPRYKSGTLGQTLVPQRFPHFPKWDSQNPCPTLEIAETLAALGDVPLSHFCSRGDRERRRRRNLEENTYA